MYRYIIHINNNKNCVNKFSSPNFFTKIFVTIIIKILNNKSTYLFISVFNMLNKNITVKYFYLEKYNIYNLYNLLHNKQLCKTIK